MDDGYAGGAVLMTREAVVMMMNRPCHKGKEQRDDKQYIDTSGHKASHTIKNRYINQERTGGTRRF